MRDDAENNHRCAEVLDEFDKWLTLELMDAIMPQPKRELLAQVQRKLKELLAEYAAEVGDV